MSKDSKIFYDHIYPIFLEICNKPHPSGGEEPLVEYIVEEIKKLNLDYKVDKMGNIAVFKKASEGLENLPPLIFQGHTDMVCVPDKNIFPVEPVIKDGWVCTDGTTLGADNGIALAYMLQLMKTDFEKNPPLEFLFTVQEEVGLIGATGIDTDLIQLKGKSLINIDSEEIEMITVGCAGAKDFEAEIPVEYEMGEFLNGYTLSVNGAGGHSGIQIHEKIPNTIKVAAKIVELAGKNSEVRIVSFKGGSARNAIPANAEVSIVSENLTKEKLQDVLGEAAKYFGDQQPYEVNISELDKTGSALTVESSRNIYNLLNDVPDGVIKMNEETGGVFSSINIGQIEMDNKLFKIISSSRSCDDNEIVRILEEIIDKCGHYKGIKMEIGAGYPGWRPNLDSDLLKNTKEILAGFINKEPELLDIHAGLECGILMNKFSCIKEAVSIGPDIQKVHSVQEKLHVDSTIEIWKVVLEIIKKYSS